MTQEEKYELLRDLTARLPYGVYCQVTDMPQAGKFKMIGITIDYDSALIKFETPKKDKLKYPYVYCLSEIKPYLRHLDSMTPKETKEYNSTCDIFIDEDGCRSDFDSAESIQWLQAHHFDYRRLIERGLAVDASRLNIY